MHPDCFKEIGYNLMPITDEDRASETYVTDRELLDSYLKPDMTPRSFEFSFEVKQDSPRLLRMTGFELMLFADVAEVLFLELHGH